MQGMWVVHVVQVLCLVQLTCYVDGVYVSCVCVWLGAAWVERGGEWIGFGLYQSCGKWGLDQDMEGWCYVCVSCEYGLSV